MQAMQLKKILLKLKAINKNDLRRVQQLGVYSVPINELRVDLINALYKVQVETKNIEHELLTIVSANTLFHEQDTLEKLQLLPLYAEQENLQTAIYIKRLIEAIQTKLSEQLQTKKPVTLSTLQWWGRHEKIFADFSLFKIPTEDALIDLFKNWNDFKRLTLLLSKKQSNLDVNGQFLLKAKTLLARLYQFFKVDNYQALPAQNDVIACFEKVLPCTTSSDAGLAGSLSRDFAIQLLQLFEKSVAKIEEDKQWQQENKLLNRDQQIVDGFYLRKQQDPFFEQIEKGVIIPLLTEKNRLMTADLKDGRIPVLTTALRDIFLAEQTAKTNYVTAKEQKISGGIKQHYHRALLTISKNLINNPSLMEHRQWGTQIGKVLLNCLMAITVVPMLIKTVASQTHSPFFALRPQKTASEEMVGKVYANVRKLQPC